MGRPFHADELQAAATRRTGLSDFGDLAFRADLDALLDALNHDAQLHAAGRLALRRIVTDHLVNRLLLTRQRQRVPGIFTQPLAAPLIVTGLPRSGTTLLHRMLAADPAHHGPPYWELAEPVAQPVAQSMAQPGWPDHRRWYAALTLRLRGLLAHDLDRKHFVAVDSPEEDLHTLGATIQSWYYWMAAPVYGYLDWYLGQDQQRKYREYRACLQVLQARLTKLAPCGAMCARTRPAATAPTTIRPTPACPPPKCPPPSTPTSKAGRQARRSSLSRRSGTGPE